MSNVKKFNYYKINRNEIEDDIDSDDDIDPDDDTDDDIDTDDEEKQEFIDKHAKFDDEYSDIYSEFGDQDIYLKAYIYNWIRFKHIDGETNIKYLLINHFSCNN